MWLALLRAGWPYLLSIGLGFAGAWYWQGLRINSVRADLLILQAQVALANESARIATEKAQADTADAQGKIDAIAAELSKALAGSPRAVDVVRRVTVRLPCAADSQSGRAPPDQNPPVRTDPIADPGTYRCVRRDDWQRWRDSAIANRDRLRAVERMLEAAPDHIEITD
jgi:hypothetical protein